MVAVGAVAVVDAVDRLDAVTMTAVATSATAAGAAVDGNSLQRDSDFELFKAQAESIDDQTPETDTTTEVDRQQDCALPVPSAATTRMQEINSSVSSGNSSTHIEKSVGSEHAFASESTASTMGAPADAHSDSAPTATAPATTSVEIVATADTTVQSGDAEPNPASVEEQPRRFVSPKDFDLLKVVGIGAFGKVLQVRNKRSRQVLAMKIISKRLLRRKGDSVIENVLAERNILKRLGRHPFVVAMHCSFQTREKLFIIMDFLAGGELFQRLGKEGIFLEKTAAFYLAEIISALEHLHSHGVLHRDLKPENILLSSDGHVCLTDFGLAKDFSSGDGFSSDADESLFRALTICGTGEYMAPEMIARMGYGRAADYWSLGCICYEMLAGRPPFESKQGAKVLFKMIMMEKVKMPSGSSAAACKLIKGLLNRNVQARLGAARSTMFDVGGVAGLKKQDFFAAIDWEKLVCKQIAPPAVFAVEHDGDVQHFHEEFTQMSLPRSVIEMSVSDFTPRRVESDKFRGFSFIQDDFQLPERDQVEERSYWDSIEEDGESVSECASSKMGDLVEAVEQLANQQQQPNAASSASKRPPRKRKKKVPAAGESNASTPVGTAGNTPLASRSNTPEPSEIGDLTERLDELEIDTTNVATSAAATPTAQNDCEPESKAAPPIATESPQPPVKPAVPPRKVEEVWQTAKKPDTSAKSKQNSITKQSTFTNVATNARTGPPWTRAGSSPTASQRKPLNASTDEQWRSTKSPVKTNRPSVGSTPLSGRTAAPTRPPGYEGVTPNRPPANGWNSAGMSATVPGRANGSQQQPWQSHQQQPSLVSAAPPPSSSTDWRNHSMSHHRPPPPPSAATATPPMTSDGPLSWPTLGGPSPVKEAPLAKVPVAKGAWATARR